VCGARGGGLCTAQYNLGGCYKNGEGVRKDAEKAVEWCRKAATLGQADAQCNLGCCYLNGQGVSKDVGKAVEWFRKAAMLGHAKAQQAMVDLGLELHTPAGRCRMSPSSVSR
jgi:TPR repeat protein